MLTIAVTIASLGGVALAAALSESSITPSNGSTVQDSQPRITATYSATLSPQSTIALSRGNTAIDCPQVVSGTSISCTPSSLLSAGTYTVKIHAINASNASDTVDNSSTFVVNVPSLTNVTPAMNATVAVLPNGVVLATFDQAIDDPHSTIHMQQVADMDGNPQNHTPLTGAITFPDESMTIPDDASTKQNDATQIQFRPDSNPIASGVYRVSIDAFGVASSGVPGAANTYVAKAKSSAIFALTIDNRPPTMPASLSAPPITQANVPAVHFTGTGRPGNSITVDLTDGTNHVNNNSSAVTIANCVDTPSCPWTVTLDAHTLNDTTSGYWTATAHNAAGTTVAPTQAIVKDTTPPASPSVALSLPAGSPTMHVSGTDNDATLDHYSVTASDTHGHNIGPVVLTRAAGAVSGSGAYATDIDVSALDDGTINVIVTPFDSYDNQPVSGASASVLKNVGVLPRFDASSFVVNNGDTIGFPTALNRHAHAIMLPNQIVVEFNNPITLIRHDNGTIRPQDIPAGPPYVIDNDGHGNSFNGSASVDPKDNRRLNITPPKGLADGAYTLHVTVFEDNGTCDFNSDPVGGSPADPCPGYDGLVLVPGTSTPFDFTVDTHPPTAATGITTTPSTITAASVDATALQGAAEPYGWVTVDITSDGGTGLLKPNGGQPIPVDADGSWSTAVSGLESLPDGQLIVRATAHDEAGNAAEAGSAYPTPTLAARPSVPRSIAVSDRPTGFDISWVAPSYDGYGSPATHLTGYTLTYRDNTSGASDTATHTLEISDPNLTKTSVSGLVTGDEYSVMLCAHNAIGGPCHAASTNAVPRGESQLSASLSRSLVTYGQSVVLSGRLIGRVPAAALANRQIIITTQYDDRHAGPTSGVTTGSDGRWSLNIARPARDTFYRVWFAGDHAYAPSSAVAYLRVAEYLRTDRISARGRDHRYPVTISGHLAPSQPYRYVVVYARVAAARHYQRLGSVRLSSRSTWAWTHLFPRGTYYVYFRFFGQNGNQSGNSQSARFSRT